MPVHIRRREDTDSHLPVEVVNESKKFLGSVLVNGTPLRGLDREEEKKLLPRIIGLNPDHPDFDYKANDYWAEMSILVPVAGTVLNSDTVEGEPVEIEDYIKFKWASNHPLVAKNEEELNKNPLASFYIFDPEIELKRKNTKVQARKQADVEFVKVSKDLDKMKRVLRLMTDYNPDNMTQELVENNLFQAKDDNPKQFLEIVTDKNMDVKAEIAEMIEYSVLRKIGNQVIFIDEVLGQTIDDTVIFFKDKKNSETLLTLRAKLKEAKRE